MIAIRDAVGSEVVLAAPAGAYDHASANVLAPFSYVQIIAATLFGLVAFGDVPDLWTLIGSVLIIAAGVYVMRGSSGR